MMERAEETTGTKAQTTLADAGYFSGSHLEECASRGQPVVVSEARLRFLKDPYHKDQFTYDEQSDSLYVPTGADARVRPHTACERSPIASVPSFRRRLPGVSSLQSLYKDQGDWAKSGRRAARCGATSPSRLDGQLSS